MLNVNLSKVSDRNTPLNTVYLENEHSRLALTFSYETIIAFRGFGQSYCRENEWGPTTGRHMHELGFPPEKRVPADKFLLKLNEAFELFAKPRPEPEPKVVEPERTNKLSIPVTAEIHGGIITDITTTANAEIHLTIHDYDTDGFGLDTLEVSDKGHYLKYQVKNK